MKIIVENSAYHLQNMGDVAMLQIGVDRLRHFFPDATISVFTTNPSDLQKHVPNVLAISPVGRNIWSSPLIHKLHNLPQSSFRNYWCKLERNLRSYAPLIWRTILVLKLRRFPKELIALKEFIQMIREANLVVSTGGGFITDSFFNETASKLESLSLAAKLGKPTVIFGQGIGPLNDSMNYNQTKSTLPQVDLITLREKRTGLPILHSMNIAPEKIIVTGDDAVELAFNARKQIIGNAIGINLRVANYSSVTEESIKLLRKIIQDFARSKEVSILPIPIEHASSCPEVSSDSDSIRELLKGFDETSDGGRSLDTPLKVIEQAGRCRVVVTGSYHAGVFALSQGIPVIGLAKSQYYTDKFEGLSEQFPGGCKTLLINEINFADNLKLNLQNFWNEGELIRPNLLNSAKQQVELSYMAYERLCAYVK